MLKILALLTLLASTAVHAQTPLQTDLPLKYLEQASADSTHQPLVIFLHGYGSNEQDLFGIKDDLPASYTYLSVRAPLVMEAGSYQWFRKKGEGAYNGETDDLKSSGQVLLDFVAQATKKYHTEPEKVFLVGFSQGAIMSYEVGLRHPEALGGIAALSGRVLPVLKAELMPDENASRWRFSSVMASRTNAFPTVTALKPTACCRACHSNPSFTATPVSAITSAPTR